MFRRTPRPRLATPRGRVPSFFETVPPFPPLHSDAWWLAVFPGLALFVAVASFNLVGESLRDALDPHVRSLALPGADRRRAERPPPRTTRPERGEREPTGDHQI